MTMPRQILPGSTYLISRRCSERRFLLRPDSAVVRVFLFCLGHAARACGIRLHAFVVLSNHWHAVVTDPKATLPLFLARVHRLVAVVVNVLRGRWEALWSSDKPSYQRLEGPEDIVDKMVYVFTNPVSSGLVERAEDWPGLRSSPDQMLRSPASVERPSVYFRKKSTTPARVEVALDRPPGFKDMTDEELVAMLRRRVEERQAELVAERKRQGGSFLGVSAILEQDWRCAPQSEAPRRNLNPTVASKDEDKRACALARRRKFLDDYREALDRWMSGDKCARFPAGTYLLRALWQVHCHPPP